jgi:hypothetical protein
MKAWQLLQYLLLFVGFFLIWSYRTDLQSHGIWREIRVLSTIKSVDALDNTETVKISFEQIITKQQGKITVSCEVGDFCTTVLLKDYTPGKRMCVEMVSPEFITPGIWQEKCRKPQDNRIQLWAGLGVIVLASIFFGFDWLRPRWLRSWDRL